MVKQYASIKVKEQQKNDRKVIEKGLKDLPLQFQGSKAQSKKSSQIKPLDSNLLPSKLENLFINSKNSD